MNTRRNRKKVDYSKFCGAADSDEDDDFQDSPNNSSSKKLKSSDECLPPDKPKKERKPPEKAKKKNEGKKENEREANQGHTKPKRNTRVSNAEEIYDQDILTAIEVSKSSSPVNPPVTVISEDEDLVNSLLEECINSKSTSLKWAQRYKSELVNNNELEATIPIDSLEPQLSSTRHVDTTEKSKASNKNEDDWCESEGERDEDSDFAEDDSDDEVDFSPVKKKAKIEPSKTKPSVSKSSASKPCTSKPTLSKPTISKHNSDNAKKTAIQKSSTATSLSTPISKPLGIKASKSDIIKKNDPFKSPSVNYASSSVRNSPISSFISPTLSSGGRLRLGLSRNKRIGKPLHANFSMKTS